MGQQNEETGKAQVSEGVRKQRIADSKYDVQWIVDALNANDPKWKKACKGRTVTRFAAADISNGKGFASKISKVSLIFENGDEYAVALKVPTMERLEALMNKEKINSERLQSTLKQMDIAIVPHALECDFYGMHTESVGIPLPGIYALEYAGQNEREGAILMEYLGNSACCVPLNESFTLQQLKSVARYLARLHAFSLDISEDQLLSMKALQEFGTALADMASSAAFRTIEADPRNREPFNRLKHLMKPSNYMDYYLYGIHKELGMRPVICHGDLWNNNILVKKNSDGAAGSDIQAFIDWQTMHAGNAGEDFGRIMNMADAEIRREAELVIFDIYYKTLESEAARKGKPTPFTKEQVEKAYRRSFVAQALFVFSTVMMMENNVIQSSANKHVSEARVEKALLRVRLALLDALQIVEKEIPEWLNPNYRYVD